LERNQLNGFEDEKRGQMEGRADMNKGFSNLPEHAEFLTHPK
jgi:hypothetical protein